MTPTAMKIVDSMTDDTPCQLDEGWSNDLEPNTAVEKYQAAYYPLLYRGIFVYTALAASGKPWEIKFIHPLTDQKKVDPTLTPGMSMPVLKSWGKMKDPKTNEEKICETPWLGNTLDIVRHICKNEGLYYDTDSGKGRR